MEHLSSFIIQLISSVGYLGVFSLMLLESALLPIPSEVTMPFAGFLAQQGHLSFLMVVFLGALGNLVGSLIAYALGFYLEETIILSFINRYGKYIFLRKHEYEKAMTWFKKYGNSITFFSRLLPGIRTFISLPAGLSEMKVSTFIFYTFTGSLLWSLFLTSIGYYLGKNWGSMHAYFTQAHIVIGAAILAAIGWYLYTHIYKKKHKSN